MIRRSHVAMLGIWSVVMAASLYAAVRHEPAYRREGVAVAKLTLADGSVQYRPQEIAVWDYASKGQDLYADEVVATGTGAKARLELGGGRSIDMAEHTQLSLAAMQGGQGQYVVTLLKGKIEAASDSDAHGASGGGGAGATRPAAVVVQFGQKQVQLAGAGTRFELTKSVKDKTITLDVKSGSVETQKAGTIVTDEPPAPGKLAAKTPAPDSEIVKAGTGPQTFEDVTPQPTRTKIDVASATITRAKDAPVSDAAPMLRSPTPPAPKVVEPPPPPPAPVEEKILPPLPDKMVVKEAPKPKAKPLVAAVKPEPVKEPEPAPVVEPLKPEPVEEPEPAPVVEAPKPEPVQEDVALATEGEDEGEPLVVVARPNPLGTINSTAVLRYGAPLLPGALVSKVGYAGATVESRVLPLGGLRAGVDVFTRGEDQIDGFEAAFQETRGSLGYFVEKKFDWANARVEAMPRIGMVTLHTTLPYTKDDKKISGDLDATNVTAAGADVCSEIGTTSLIFRIGGGYTTTLASGGDKPSFHAMRAGGDLIYNVYESRTWLLSVLGFSFYEKSKVTGGADADEEGRLRDMEFNQGFAGAGLQVAW